jgi:ABC-type transport system involved in multi-copper enzyme maturation permease subunit
MQSMNGEPLTSLLVNTLILLVWSAAFFAIGVWRFNKRYA